MSKMLMPHTQAGCSCHIMTPSPATLSNSPGDIELVELIRDLIASGRRVRIAARGWSMRPCVRNGDIVEIQPAPPDAFLPGDIGAYISSSRELASEHPDTIVVHRFLGRCDGKLIFRGDSCPANDTPVPPSAILGRIVIRERRGKRVEIGKGLRRKAGRLNILLGPATRFALRIRSLLGQFYRGGPNFTLGGSRQVLRDRAVLSYALGASPNAHEERSVTGRSPALDLLAEDERYQHLLPLISWRTRAQPEDYSPDFRESLAQSPLPESLREMEDLALLRSAQDERALREISRIFQKKGLEVLVVKGAALAFTGVYPLPHLRPSVDIDFICRPEDKRQAVEALLAQGYVNAEPAYPISYYFAYRNEVALKKPDHSRPFLEIHWGQGGPLYYTARFPVARLWKTSRKGPWGAGLRVLMPEMEMVHALVHLAKHFRALRPGWALDLALLARRVEDWNQVLAEITRARLQWPAFYVFEWTESRIPGTIPEGLINHMKATRRRAPGNWMEMRVLHAKSDRSIRWIDALSLPTRRQRLGYLREQLAPSRTVMERLYPQAKGRWLAPYYLRRWGRLAGEIIKRSS